MEDCVFCKIVKGEIPSHRVYGDDDAVAFLDVNPVTEGHVLVVPRDHAGTLTDMEPSSVPPLFAAAREVAAALESALDPAGLNLIQNNGGAAGQEVPHVHVHLVPRYSPGDGVDVTWRAGELDDDRAAEIVDEVRGEL